MVELPLTHEIESPSGISRVGDLDYQKGGNLAKKSECPSQRGAVKSPEKFKLRQYRQHQTAYLRHHVGR